MRKRQVLVSIHDVTPAHAPLVRTLWSLCEQRGVIPALFVVPDWHGVWPIEQHHAFMNWVRSCAARGADIIVHGERHDEVGLARDLASHWRAFGRTDHEAEFLTLPYPAADARIARGIARLRAQYLSPVGFVPPAWLARHDAHDAARANGLALSEDEHRVYLHAQGTRLEAPAWRLSGRSTWRALASDAISQWRWHVWQSAPLVRLALHPQDLSHPRTRACVERDLGRWTERREVVSYRSLTVASPL